MSTSAEQRVKERYPRAEVQDGAVWSPSSVVETDDCLSWIGTDWEDAASRLQPYEQARAEAESVQHNPAYAAVASGTVEPTPLQQRPMPEREFKAGLIANLEQRVQAQATEVFALLKENERLTAQVEEHREKQNALGSALLKERDEWKAKAESATEWLGIGGRPLVIDGVHLMCRYDPKDEHEIYGAGYAQEGGYLCELHKIRFLEAKAEALREEHDAYKQQLLESIFALLGARVTQSACATMRCRRAMKADGWTVTPPTRRSLQSTALPCAAGTKARARPPRYNSGVGGLGAGALSPCTAAPKSQRLLFDAAQTKCVAHTVHC